MDAEDYEAPFIRMDDVNIEAPASPTSITAARSPVSATSSTYQEDSDAAVPYNPSSYSDGPTTPRSAASAAAPQSPSKKDRSGRTSSTRRKKSRRGSRYGFKEGSSIWSETVDVWSEFLGFKNSTYSVRGASRSSLLPKDDTMTDRDEDAHVMLTDVEEDYDPKNGGRTSGKPPLSPRNSSSQVGSPVVSRPTTPAVAASTSGTTNPLTTIDSAKDDGNRLGEVRSSKSKEKSSRSARTLGASNKSASKKKVSSSAASPSKNQVEAINRGEEV